jgi:hypothetical protein
MINRQSSRNPRRLPYPEEIRKTTEPLNEPPDSTAPDVASIKRPGERPQRPPSH